MAGQTTPTELEALRARVDALEAALGADRGRHRRRGHRRRWLGVALVALLALLPAALGASDRFDDVPDGAFFHDDASALADAGITLGCGGDNYCPDAVVTRGQMASFLARTAGLGSNAPVANAKTLAGYAPSGLVRSAQVEKTSGFPGAVTAFVQTYATLTIVAPSAGFVLVTSVVRTLDLNNTGCPCQVFFSTDGTHNKDTSGFYRQQGIVDGGSTTHIYPVAQGTQTFALIVTKGSDSANLNVTHAAMTAIFVPFGYDGGATLAP